VIAADAAMRTMAWRAIFRWQWVAADALAEGLGLGAARPRGRSEVAISVALPRWT
jgi:hypothetical protein